MKDYLTIILLGFCLISLHSCFNSAPYEVRSPCVAVESNNPYVITPCTKIPANIDHVIT